MTAIPYWLQNADLHSTDYAPVGVAEAIRVVAAQPWEQELSRGGELEAEGADFCDPGIGFVAPWGHVLHICPQPDGRFYYHYHYSERRRLLGLIPAMRQQSATRMDVAGDELPGVIEHFFANDQGWLVSHARRAAG